MDLSSFWPWAGPGPGPWFFPWAGSAPGPWFFPYSASSPSSVLTLFGQEATGSTLVSDATAYTFGVNFYITQSASPNAIWFYSPPGAAALPGTIAIYKDDHTLVHSEAASWSGAAGSGWVRAAFASPPSLNSQSIDNYFACVCQASAVNWYSATSHYWDSGAGSGGITDGYLGAYSNAGAVLGQDTYNLNSVLGFPGDTFNATNYWVDVEFPI